jgi:ribonuclease P protein component
MCAPIEGFDEADVSAKQRQAGEAARFPATDVDARRSRRLEGPSPSRAGATVRLTGSPGRVRGRTTFAALAASERQFRSGPVTVHFLPSDGDLAEVLVAYAIGRHVGGAVVRNRWRRRLRVIAAEISPELAFGTYLVRLGRGVADIRFDELRGRVIETMRRASGESR